MPRLEMADGGPSKYVSAATGTVRPGQTVTVGSAAADTLLDKPFFEPSGDVVLSEDEYSIEDTTAGETGGFEEKTYDELYDLATEADISGRSDMTKDDLVESILELRVESDDHPVVADE